MRHVVKLGPLQFGQDSAHAYVAFGQDGLDMVLEGSDDEGIAALRRKCGAIPLVTEPALAKVAAAHGLKVAELPPPMVALKASLAVIVTHGPWLDAVHPTLVIELIEAAAAFEFAAPWKGGGLDGPLTIRLDTGRTYEGLVVGASGEEVGLALYHQAGSVARVQAFIAAGRPEAAVELPSTTLFLTTESAFCVAAVHAMVKAKRAPLVVHVTPRGPTAARSDDVAAVIAALRAVTALAAGRPPRGECREPAHRVVAQAARATGTPAIARTSYANVGRNEPCPCGSGKKYKRCHLAEAEAAAAPPPAPSAPRAPHHERDERLSAQIISYGAQRFGDDVLERHLTASLGTAAPGSLDQLLTPWLAYVLQVEGEPLGAHFLRARGAGLSAADRRWIERQLATPLGVWEVLRVEPGRGVDVVELLTGARCFVHEVKASALLAPRDAVLGRVVVDEVAVFCGIHEVPFDPTNADAVVARFQEAPSGDAATRLLALWKDQVAAMRRRSATPVKITNTDGHEALVVEDRFGLSRENLEPVFARLAALEDVHVIERDRTGARLTFTRVGNAQHAQWANTVIGSARLTPTRLTLEANSAERADALTARVRDALGDLATWKKRTRTPLPELHGGEAMSIDSQLVTTPAAAAMEDAYREWLDQPIPILDGRTPRQAVADTAGRHRVHVLLKQQEHQHARRPIAGFEPARSRLELGLDELGQPLGDLDHDLVRAFGAGRKLSETVLDFARPMLDVVGARRDVDDLRAALGFAIAVWNAAVDAATTSEVPTLGADLDAPPWSEWREPLLTRKRARFAHDRRLVGYWHVGRDRDQFDVQMETRVPPELVARLDASPIARALIGGGGR